MGTRNNVVMLSSYKGGAGKSTIAMNLATAILRQGAGVVVVDLDGSSKTSMNWRQNWYAVNPDADKAGKAPPLPQVVQVLDNVTDMLEKLSTTYDYVVVDAGAGAPRQNQEAIKVADLLLIPVSPSQFDIQPTLAYLLELEAVQRRFGRPKARVVLNQMAKGKAATEELVSLFRSGQATTIPTMETEIPQRESLKRLLMAGVSVYDYAQAKSDLREAFDNLAVETLTSLATGVAPSNSSAKAA